MTDKEIENRIAISKNLIILFCSHDTCVPCKSFKPVLINMVDNFNGLVELVQVDVTESAIPTTYGVRHVPTMIFIKEGVTLEIYSGSFSENALRELIKSAI